jgi:hypothetical protein
VYTKVCQWLATSRWLSTGTPVSSTNKTDRDDIAEILLKVALNTITLTDKSEECMMFDLSLHPVVCRRAHVFLTLLVFVLRTLVSNTYCVVFLFCFYRLVLPVFLDCPLLIALSVFSNVYLLRQSVHIATNVVRSNSAQVRCIRYNIMCQSLSVTCDKSVLIQQ